jgi:type III secretion protein Q
MTPQPLRLRTLTRTQAGLTSGLAGAARRIATTFEGEPWTLRFLPAGNPLPDARTIPFQLAGTPASLHVSPTPGGNWHRRFESAPPLETVPEPFRSALHAALCEEILNAVETATGLTARLTDPDSADATAPRDAIGWEATASRGQSEASGILEIAPEITGKILTAAKSWAAEPDPGWLDAILFTAPIILEALPVSPAAFQDAAPGDIWLLTGSGNGDALRAMVRFPGASLPARISGVPERPPTSVAPTPPDLEPTESMNTTDAAHWTDDLNVELAFQLGTLTLTVEELRRLEAGHIFELNAPLDEPVTLLLNGKPSGRGELVRIGDRLGVQLTAKTSVG